MTQPIPCDDPNICEQVVADLEALMELAKTDPQTFRGLPSVSEVVARVQARLEGVIERDDLSFIVRRVTRFDIDARGTASYDASYCSESDLGDRRRAPDPAECSERGLWSQSTSEVDLTTYDPRRLRYLDGVLDGEGYRIVFFGQTSMYCATLEDCERIVLDLQALAALAQADPRVFSELSR